MCDFEKGFKLCTCKDENGIPKNIKHNKKSRKNKKKEDDFSLEFEWGLFEFKEKIKPVEMGRYMLPSSDIGKGLSSEWVLLNLNIEKCFDFEYRPKEGDNLVISEKGIGKSYLSFIYKEDRWIEDSYDAFSDVIMKKSQGKLLAKEV